MGEMTVQQKIKHLILIEAVRLGQVGLDVEVNEGNIDEIYMNLMLSGVLQDAEEEVRVGDVDTDIDPGYSRHYESRSVATQMLDGSWVGWTYWYGGGKHGDPGAIEWIEDAYPLNVHEEEKLVVVRTFTKREDRK
jgi:hypothetical protein